MKLLTVSVPCYNSQDYMEKCVESLLAGGERVEILIVDDGSKDRTGEIADRLAAEHPTIIRAIHQPNKGHGGGINTGVRNATGRYFKNVDSDDWLSEDFPKFLDTLEDLERQGGVDLVLTNYYYVHADSKGDRSIDFSNALPEGRIFGWKDVRPFRVDQLLMIHAVTYRTDFLRKANVQLPEHLFYEDNCFVYANLKDSERLYYCNMDLYRYWIGREGQSVSEEVMIKRCGHQRKATEICLTQYHLDTVTDRCKRRYCKHTLFLMLGIALTSSRHNGSPEAEQGWKDLWKTYYAYDPKWARHFRHFTPLCFFCLPGGFGRWVVRRLYHLAHRIVRFN